MSNSIFERAIQNEVNKEELMQALDEMNQYVGKLENRDMMKELVESWHKFVKYITQEVPQYIKKHTLNTVPHIVTVVSEMKNRQDIKDGKLNLKQALKRASGWDAASFLSSRLIDIAIQIGADLNSKECGLPIKSIGMPAAHYATLQNNYNCASTLLSRGAKLDFQCKNGLVPLHYAFINEKNQQIRESILNADILSEYIKANSQKLRSLIIEKSKDMNVPSKTGETPLHCAMANNVKDLDSLTSLFTKGASPDRQDIYGNTPLHISAFKGNLEHMTLLAKYKADPNIQNVKGSTPLHWAGRKKDHKSFDFLVGMGAKTDILDNAGFTPMDYLNKEIHLEHSVKQNQKSRVAFDLPKLNINQNKTDRTISLAR